MKRIINEISRLPLNKKITYMVIIYLCLITIICIALFCYTYYGTSMSNLLSNMERQSQLLSQSIDKQLEMYINITDNAFSNKKLMEIFEERREGTYRKIKYNIDIQEFMLDISASASGVSDMYFEDEFGDMVAIGNLPRECVSEAISVIRERVNRSGTDAQFSAFSYGEETGIVLGRMITSVDELYHYSHHGIIYVFINADTIFQRYQNLFGKENRIYILDEENRILLDSAGESIGEKLTEESYVRGGTEYIEIDNKLYYCLSSILAESGCKMIFAEECEGVTKPIVNVILRIFVVLIIILLLLSGTARFVSDGIARPIRVISGEIDNIKETHFKKKLSEDVDEILYPIVKSYNMMIDTLDRLVNKELAYQVKFKDAAFKAYEQQINPHFIYNTLNMVKVLANYGESDKIDIIVTGISDMMKFAKRTDQTVLIADEISNIESYFSILDIRFGENFKYSISVDDEVASYKTFKFILQPIVENAVKYGIENIDEVGVIDVSVSVRGENVEFMVADNGVGIPEDKLNKIIERLENTDIYSQTDMAGIGISNIYQRGKLKYGDEFYFKIESRAGQGTRVTIAHPVEKNSDGERTDGNIQGEIL